MNGGEAMDLYFVRHGRTEMNVKRLLQGQGGYGLLPEGRVDARRAADALGASGVTRVYASDQQRAIETAAILREGLGLRGPTRISKALREIDFGTMSGRPVDVVRRLCPRYATDSTFVFPGGESFDALQRRALHWVDAIERRRPARAIVVVTHGGWLRTLFVALRGADLNRCLEGSIPHGLVARLTVGRKRSLRILEPVGIFDRL